MAVNDIRSNLKQTQCFNRSISSSTTTVGVNANIIDTANFELGLMFALLASTYTTAGTYTLLLEESDDSLMVGAVTISGDKLIGTLPAVSGQSPNGGDYGTVGVISNLRYVRASIVSTGVTGSAQITVIATQKGENLPID